MNIQKATFANGCFWCTEAIFQNVKGVHNVEPGYMGDKKFNPTYIELCNGGAGYTEVIRFDYDADTISYLDLLVIFFRTHNPTFLDRRDDAARRYRSVIFYHNDEQKNFAKTLISKLNAEKIFDKPIITELTPSVEFYAAAGHHQNYYQNNKLKPYCISVIQPRMNKFASEFGEM